MDANRLLGLPLQDALDLLRAQGIEPTVTVTRAPRDEREGGCLRVLRVVGTELVAAAFHEDLKYP